MIKIVAPMKVKPECVEAFKETARDLIEKSRAEEGNVYYTLNVKTDAPCTLAFIECWKDQEAIDIHNETEHFTGILPKLGEMCEEGQPGELFTEVEY